MPWETNVVVCVPDVCAGRASFASWHRLSTHGTRLLAVRLPGREDLLDAPAPADVERAVEYLEAEYSEALACSGAPRSIAFFGHGLGSLLACELARSAEARGRQVVRHVFVSGPDWAAMPAADTDRWAAAASDDQLLGRVEELTGHRHPAFDVRELRTPLLRTLRADLRLRAALRTALRPGLAAPVTYLCGDAEGSAGRGWESLTGGLFRRVELPGGRRFLAESAATVVDLITSTLAR